MQKFYEKYEKKNRFIPRKLLYRLMYEFYEFEIYNKKSCLEWSY